MGKKSECIRVPILLRMDNPRHQLVYNILENVDNKSAYIREAVIYYYRHNGISMKSDDILDIMAQLSRQKFDVFIMN